MVRDVGKAEETRVVARGYFVKLGGGTGEGAAASSPVFLNFV